jgi:hypothetical protein
MSGVYQRYSGVFPTEQEAIKAFYNYPSSQEKKRNNMSAQVMKEYYAQEAAKKKERNRILATGKRNYGPAHSRRNSRKGRKSRKNRR